MLRAFEDESVAHEENSVDPVRDLDIIFLELGYKDVRHIERIKKDLEKFLKRPNDCDKTKVEFEM